MSDRHIERMVVRVRGVARTDAVALAEAAAAAIAMRSWSAPPPGPLVVRTAWRAGEAASETGERVAGLVTGALAAPRGGRP